MKLIVIEGQHAGGKTTHTLALAEALRRVGMRASAWRHRAPAATDPYGAALDFAAQRWLRVTSPLHPADEVIVADRWIESTVAVGWTLDAKTRKADRNALLRLATAERAVLPVASLVVVLDTSDDELDRRLLTRGHPVTERDRACREVYRDPSVLGPWGAVRVDTDRPVEVVEAEVLTLALRALGVG